MRLHGKDAKTQASDLLLRSAARAGVPDGRVGAGGRLSPAHLRPPHPQPRQEGASYLAFCVLFPPKVGRLALALGNGASADVLVTLSLLSCR